MNDLYGEICLGASVGSLLWIRVKSPDKRMNFTEFIILDHRQDNKAGNGI